MRENGQRKERERERKGKERERKREKERERERKREKERERESKKEKERERERARKRERERMLKPTVFETYFSFLDDCFSVISFRAYQRHDFKSNDTQQNDTKIIHKLRLVIVILGSIL